MNAPDKIWTGTEYREGPDDEWAYGHWYRRPVYSGYTPYIRADIADALKSRVKELEAALRSQLQPRYGLQGICEDFGHDANAYNYHAAKYWRELWEENCQIARAALGPADEVRP